MEEMREREGEEEEEMEGSAAFNLNSGIWISIRSNENCSSLKR